MNYGLFSKSPEHSVHETCAGMFQIMEVSDGKSQGLQH